MLLIIKRTNNDVLDAIGLQYSRRERFDSMSQFCIQTNGSYSLIAQKATLGLIPGYCEKKWRLEDIDMVKSETIERVGINFRTKFYLKNRCIIPVDGFIVYQYINETGSAMQKQFVTAADGKPIVIAKIWNRFNIHLTFCILTRPATGIMQEISNRGRNRMPMILSPGKYDDWLAGKPLEDFVADDVAVKAEVVPRRFTYGLAK